MRARFRLYDPGLFNEFRTLVFGKGQKQGLVHCIYARHRHTGKWTCQALTFLVPSWYFPDLAAVAEWVVDHGYKQEKQRFKIEQGGTVAWFGWVTAKTVYTKKAA